MSCPRGEAGAQIVAADIAAEFGVSVDTVRRDIIALEQAGRARSGAAAPCLSPNRPGPFSERLRGTHGTHMAIADAALRRSTAVPRCFWTAGPRSIAWPNACGRRRT